MTRGRLSFLFSWFSAPSMDLRRQPPSCTAHARAPLAMPLAMTAAPCGAAAEAHAPASWARSAAPRAAWASETEDLDGRRPVVRCQPAPANIDVKNAKCTGVSVFETLLETLQPGVSAF